MTFFITGVSGFLGSRLALSWTRRGHTVSGSARNLGRWIPTGVKAIELELGGKTSELCLARIDSLIHTAHDFNAGADVNVNGTKEFFKIASSDGVSRQIFVSSYSARPDSTTDYGRTKFILETFFLDQGHTIVRPGVVLGNGGLFGRNMEKILSFPIMPLLDGGKDLLPVIGIDDFLSAMTIIAESGVPGAYNLFYPQLVTMRDLIDMVNHFGQHRTLHFSIPASAATFCLQQLSRLGIRTPVTTSNLNALKQNQIPVHASDLESILPNHVAVEGAVAQAVKSFRASNTMVQM